MFEKLLKRFFWVPLVLGMLGYLAGGDMDVWHSLYAAAALYFVNPVNDTDNILILIAELLAIVVTTGVVLSLLGSAVSAIGRFFTRLKSGAVVVYGDSDEAGKLAATLRRGYHIANPTAPERVNTHIICFADDIETVRFYQAHNGKNHEADTKRGGEMRFFQDDVYLLLHTVEPYLLSDTAGSRVHILSLPDLIARHFFREHDLYDSVRKNWQPERIAIIGFSSIGAALFRCFYLNHIYTTAQRIEYHIWGADGAGRAFLSQLPTANGDRVLAYDNDWSESMSQLDGMTRIIAADGCDLTLIQRLLAATNDAEIYVYSDDGIKYEELFASDRLHTFGDMSQILTEAYIKNEPLDTAAKLFNYDYELRAAGESAPADYRERAEVSWGALNGFYRGSNTARADHHFIERRLAEDGVDEREICEVEHIRWCRYYYYNGWRYAPERDNARRRHPLLVAFDELPEAEQAKDGIYDPTLQREIERLCQ